MTTHTIQSSRTNVKATGTNLYPLPNPQVKQRWKKVEGKARQTGQELLQGEEKSNSSTSEVLYLLLYKHGAGETRMNTDIGDKALKTKPWGHNVLAKTCERERKWWWQSLAATQRTSAASHLFWPKVVKQNASLVWRRVCHYLDFLLLSCRIHMYEQENMQQLFPCRGTKTRSVTRKPVITCEHSNVLLEHCFFYLCIWQVN